MYNLGLSVVPNFAGIFCGYIDLTHHLTPYNNSDFNLTQNYVLFEFKVNKSQYFLFSNNIKFSLFEDVLNTSFQYEVIFAN